MGVLQTGEILNQAPSAFKLQLHVVLPGENEIVRK